MAKVLDFNSIESPALELVMRDDARTEISVELPSESLIDEMITVAQNMGDMVDSKDPAKIDAIYDLVARLISYNRAGLCVTADDLKGRYRMDLHAVAIFFNAYADFVADVVNGKN